MHATHSTPPRRARHAWLFALSGGNLPSSVRSAGRTFHHIETFKHDFFAATGLYRSADGPPGQLAVLKLGRDNELLTIPTAWIGRFLAGREVRAYARLHDLPGVPRLIGTVGPNGFLHDFIPGNPLGRRELVSETFFDELGQLLAAVHARDMAYVDLEKRQNILVGDDGKPYLLDFQIALCVPPGGWGRLAPARWVLRRLQAADRYHYLKHKRRLRPDLLTPEERARLDRPGVLIRLHRVLTRPLTRLRRSTLKRIGALALARIAGSAAK